MDFNCCGTEMLCVDSEGERVCVICGITYCLPLIRSPYDTPPQMTKFLYKRIQHFMNWLKRIQAQDTTSIPEPVINLVMANTSQKDLRPILRKHGYAKYYNHVPSIRLKIKNANYVPPSLPLAVERQLILDFQSLELTFLLYKDPKRKNMIPYSYILTKLFQIHDIKLDFGLRLSKNATTLRTYDKLWLNICNSLNWPFYKSVC